MLLLVVISEKVAFLKMELLLLSVVVSKLEKVKLKACSAIRNRSKKCIQVMNVHSLLKVLMNGKLMMLLNVT